QYANISYGRSYSVSGFRYYTEPTPAAANTASGYSGRAEEAVFSAQGGLYEAGQSVTVSLSAPQGSSIYYTTDCSDPDDSSMLYTGPITLSSTTILRTIVYADDHLPSLITTQSYFFGVDHTVRVVSLVSDPVNLFDYYEGIYEMGPGAVGQYASHPYGSNNKGANFWMDWEKSANVELFGLNGETILSQGCGLKLQGQYSRAEDQKAFKLITRSEYGSNRFEAALFSDCPYTEYQSFILRASGQDWDKTRMRDIVQTSLASETDVMYQAAEMCVVYINGQYWGQYNMRERINKYSIAQWEDWDSDVDAMDIIKANRTVMQGSNDSFEAIASWVDENGVDTQEDIDYVAQSVDIDNYLDYVAVQIFVGNPDLLNVKRYRSTEEDGRWRWILFDTDWGFTTDTNSMRRWLDPRGAGSEYKTDNRLFVGLMGNKTIEDKFLKRFNELMLKNWTADKILATIDEYHQILLPEIDQHLARWGFTRDQFDREMNIMIEYAEERPVKMLYYVMNTYEFSEAKMMSYFADSLAVVVPQAIGHIVSKIDADGRSKWLKEWRMDEDEFNQKLEDLYAYAEENPAGLLKTIYAVYEPNGGPMRNLDKFEAVLDAAK
ncbi:MAG: CotH kinase family protein, partial [Clostridia bacterium]|nr:CotH kinase family protein [Clostridia bacterium]